MTAPNLLHHVVYILSELVPWFILASVWILFHKDKFCHRAVVCFNVSKQPVDYIFLYKFTEPICWSFILLKVFIQFLNCLFKLFMFFIMFFTLWITGFFLKCFFFKMKVSILVKIIQKFDRLYLAVAILTGNYKVLNTVK